MESLFDKQGNQNIVDRINQLTPITLSQWGKMTVSQMLEHCQQPIKVSFGTLELKPNLISFIFGKSAKKQKLTQPRFKRSLPTVKQFKITHEPNFDEARKELIEMVSQYAALGHGAIKVTKHPFFGNMSMEEWDILQWKHLDHHLKQFGV